MFAIGEVLEVEVGAPAHGGFCVARVGEDRRVCFVSHALPGELVRARVTEDKGGSFFRADARRGAAPLQPDRVTCAVSARRPRQVRRAATGSTRLALLSCKIKESVVREQLQPSGPLRAPRVVRRRGPPAWRLSGNELLGWRTRMTYAVDPTGAAGLHRHRSDGGGVRSTAARWARPESATAMCSRVPGRV